MLQSVGRHPSSLPLLIQTVMVAAVIYTSAFHLPRAGQLELLEFNALGKGALTA